MLLYVIEGSSRGVGSMVEVRTSLYLCSLSLTVCSYLLSLDFYALLMTFIANISAHPHLSSSVAGQLAAFIGEGRAVAMFVEDVDAGLTIDGTQLTAREVKVIV